ncbi:E3 ubiquitin-protein ligase WAV3-like [Oryza glaberrima]|uniref:RING-type domain-containing protein n=1 Tax=Oryza glaberrima TaxID=4538 RepID=I1QF98_ORYGL|nr:E3 ubiquitin-protein ligase WAV3-like [Oryza glaberrima]
MASAGGRCDGCHGDFGLWEPPLTAECSHRFHLHCVVSGADVCPACNARWTNAPSKPPPQPAGGSTTPFGQTTGFPMRVRPWSSCDKCRGVIDHSQPTVTSECSHTFHLRCFSGSVICPACNARWRDTVAVPNPSPAPPSTFFPGGVPAPPPTFGPFWVSHVYGDDEPVEPPVAAQGGGVAPANNGALVVTTHCEHTAVARSMSRENFAVLVHAKAPSIAAEATAAAARAPLDLVTVLDVSGSMAGSKLALLKRAMGFVVDKLGPDDRLAIVSFSGEARRVIRLARMSDDGKASAKSAVESLAASGGTDILKGLVEAAKVLDGRRYRNAVASVILLSDGEDTYNLNDRLNSKNYSALVPPSFKRSGGRCLPVHTFGFGTDHDAAAMHTIAEETGGTFSFIENQSVVQDAFAQCIGGLLSVTVQEARIAVACSHPGVRVRSVKSGRYESLVQADGRAASVDVGELYADEERRFLVFVDVPAAGAGEDATELIKVSCTYRDTASRQQMVVAGEDAVVERPVEVTTTMEPSIEVERERFRVEATEDIAAAQEAAERGAHAAAKAILDRRQEALARSTRGLAGDARCAALVSELRELSARVASRREYEQTGRACMLAGMSSHAQQRATSVQLFGRAAPTWSMPMRGSAGRASFSLMDMELGGYVTPAMRSMVESSRKRREGGDGSLSFLDLVRTEEEAGSSDDEKENL